MSELGDYPNCPARAWRILMVDDDQTFADLIRMHVADHYLATIELTTLVPPQRGSGSALAEKIEGILRNSYDTENPFDTVLIDQNMPGLNGLDVLKQIDQLKREFSPMRFLPVVMMTAHREKSADRMARALGVFRFIDKLGGAGIEQNGPETFLHQILLSLPELRDQSEDQIWMEFIQEATERLNSEEGLEQALQKAASFLETYLAAEATYVRVKNAEGLLTLYGGTDIFCAGKTLNPASVPFLQRLMDPVGPDHFLTTALDEADLGRLLKKGAILGSRAAAVPIFSGSERIGTVALYRNACAHPFRTKDIHNLRHFALVISARERRDSERKRIQERQKKLAKFIEVMAGASDEAKLADSLLDLLHGEFHGDDNIHSKATIRLIEPGSTRMPRKGWRGLPPGFNGDLRFDQDGSVYAHVVKTATSIRISDVRECNATYCTSHADICSELAAPLMAGECCMGAVNLEHTDVGYYDQGDQEFVEALANIAANGLINIRAEVFFSAILKLIGHLVDRTRPVDFESLLQDAFMALHRFSGYCYLVYMVPGPSAGDPWRVERLLGEDGRDATPDDLALWQVHVEKNWVQTFVYKSLVSSARFTRNFEDIVQEEGFGTTGSMMVVHLTGGNGGLTASETGEIVGMVALLFRHSRSINSYQIAILENFGRFLGALLQTGRNIKTLMDERTLDGQMAVLGQALGQLRHRLRSELGNIGNILNRARREYGVDGAWAEDIRDVLDAVGGELDSSRFFIKVPVPGTFRVVDVWDRVKATCRGRADLQQVHLDDFEGKDGLEWISDPDIVALILENLVQNSIEALDDYAEVGNRRVWLMAAVQGDRLKLTVRDNGPGIPVSHRDKLFNMGFTTKSKGTGFALHFSRRRARDLGGDLDFDVALVSDIQSTGAAFSLELPARNGGKAHG